ncbi:DUF2235 domain-containing protein [Iodobacter sp. CM08]|uniref:T6SS phospholipase effector Tle1-like catalytic domain-containing protein n=1 Tax=Iodobacter sp. CM08 TaxID=3085902 RepID=UPI002981D176|nr:DUF2235 domain-containing protein [Iodobacter sp. CM08]MDW5418477.1 DUF2235 domain-containing protein [Iodobacter sp. CM08]
MSKARSPSLKIQAVPLQASADFAQEEGADSVSAAIMPVLPMVNTPTFKPAQGLKCCITLNLAFFFDGTGNNVDADEGTFEHSNVARLFRAHADDDVAIGVYRFYIPGLGTYFKDIGDDGGGTLGLAFGGGGTKRLDWAEDQFKTVVGHTQEEITEIRVSLFGFSRGAASARAFALILDKLCPDGLYQLPNGKDAPLTIYFMGLFDTVASVGLPAGSGVATALAASDATSAKWAAYEKSLVSRRNNHSNGLAKLAFGEPGADPSPTWADGHMAWASDLRIPRSGVVAHCVHMVAAHEQRHSFPSDSVRVGQHYPANCLEMVYPGMHSDVGGGYRPGEEGKSIRGAEILGQIPLLAMYQLAMEKGVPLMSMEKLKQRELDIDFDVSPDFLKAYSNYQAKISNSTLGRTVLSHMYYYFLWRFFRIKNSRAAQLKTNEDQEIGFKKDHEELGKKVGDLEEKYKQARKKAQKASRPVQNQRNMQARAGGEVDPQLLEDEAQANNELEIAKDNWLKEKAKLDSLPSIGKTGASLPMYDRLLAQETQQIIKLAQSGEKLRPHYQGLLKAWQDVQEGKGLDEKKDTELIGFFDNYMHDSLAGFATDLTLPSDPRCIYVGGDDEAKYAGLISTAKDKMA